MVQKVIQMKTCLIVRKRIVKKRGIFSSSRNSIAVHCDKYSKILRTQNEIVAVCAASDEVNCLKLPVIKHSMQWACS